MRVDVEADFDQPPMQVWQLLTDVARLAGLGPEHTWAAWAGEERGVGARFLGRNGRGASEWDVTCTVVEWVPGEAFAWVVGNPEQPVATWTYQLQPLGAGTHVTQTFVHGPGTSGVTHAIERAPDRAEQIVAYRSNELATNMRIVLSEAQALLA
jgi:uncharacterized protein YndB with AHSA1/START domain